MTAVHLRFRPAVDCNGGDSAFLCDAGDIDGVDVFFVPARAYLHGDGNVRSFHKCSEHFPEEFRVFHESAACAVAGNFRNGAARVEVDDIR